MIRDNRHLRLALGDERGLTVVEGVIGAMLLVIGVIGVLQLFDVGTRNTYRAEESQVVNNRLQAELESIKQLPYAEIALSGLPAQSEDSNHPGWRVEGSQYALARNGSDLHELVVDADDGAVNPVPTPFSAGDISGTIHRFVAWTSEARDLKRVIVAAKIDQAPISFERAFQEIQTDVVDPDRYPDDNPAPPAEDPGTTTASFWLTDTTCNNSARQPITDHHLAHNTRGVCSAGLKTGSTRGAPDLMFTEAPVIDNTIPEGVEQPTFDYATDSEPDLDLGPDIGLLMPWASTDTCALAPVLNTLDVKRLLEGTLSVLKISPPGALDGLLDLTGGDADKHKRVHTWLTPPIQGSGGVLLGSGTLELFTKTINGTVHPGQICAWLSIRQSVTIPTCSVNLLGICISTGSTTIEVDLPVINVGALSNGDCRTGTGLNLTNFQYAQDPWPAQWEKISIPMCFAAVNAAGAVIPAVLPPNSRIALSIMVKKGGTEPGKGLEFMYDAVGYESRLELATEQIIPF